MSQAMHISTLCQMWHQQQVADQTLGVVYPRRGTILCGNVWCDMLWYGVATAMLWHDMVWYGKIWYGMEACKVWYA